MSHGAKQTYSDVVSLTLDEIALIRGALAKAELDNLEEQDLQLYNALRRSKVLNGFQKDFDYTEINNLYLLVYSIAGVFHV